MSRLEYLRIYVKNTISAYKAFLPPDYIGTHPNEHGIEERIKELQAIQSILDDPSLSDES